MAEKAHHRSPAYPSIDLAYAVEMAHKFFNHARRTVVPAQNVAGYWGFSTASSGWRLALAALKQYGLVEPVGNKKSGEVKLTNLALRILLDKRQSSAERREAIKEAALNPEIYKEVWLHWKGNVPDDDTFGTYLTLHKGFNENSVPGFIADFKKTVAFAELGATDIVRLAGAAARATESVADENENEDWDGDGEDETGDGAGSGQDLQPRRRPMQAGFKEEVFALEEGAAVLQYPERLSPESFEYFESWLQLVIRKAKGSVQPNPLRHAGEE